MSDLPSLRTIVVSHTTPIFGPPHALADYLKKKSAYFIYIAHPLVYDSTRRTTVEVWQNGKKIDQSDFPNWGSSLVLNYLKDLWATIWLVKRFKLEEPIDYFFGCDSLSLMPALWLRFWWQIRSVIAYNVDYSTKRFHSGLLNSLYRWADRWTNKAANRIWCVTERIARIRRQQRTRLADVIVVPNGVYAAEVKSTGKHNLGLIFTGHLVKEKGLAPLIFLMAKMPDQKLTIYGSGPELPALKKQTAKLKLTDRINFAGQKTNAEILALLPEYSIGLALYSRHESYVTFSDPLKIKEYLAAGLPVIMTDVPEIAEAVQVRRAGAVIKDLAELPEAVIMVADQLKTMRQAATTLGQSFDWSLIFDSAMAATKE